MKWENCGHPSVNSGNCSRGDAGFPAEYVLKWEICGHPSVNSGNCSRSDAGFPAEYVLKWENCGHPSVNSGNCSRGDAGFPAEYVLKWEICVLQSAIPQKLQQMRMADKTADPRRNSNRKHRKQWKFICRKRKVDCSITDSLKNTEASYDQSNGVE
ncbi:MAG: hypothetical protein LKF52_04860 [Butyrivibrio sp.]|nr:hypothetical protein [Butyrivibrio sp.]